MRTNGGVVRRVCVRLRPPLRPYSVWGKTLSLFGSNQNSFRNDFNARLALDIEELVD